MEMSEKAWKDTSYAFPFDDGEAVCTGMTLRDYFAGQYAANAAGFIFQLEDGEFLEFAERMGTTKALEIAAKLSYEYADAMLEARK